MSFPASLTTRTVTGRFVTYPAGTPAKGTVRIVLNNFMQGPTDDAFVAPFDETIKLVNGAFSIVLPATNDPQWTASYYKVTITADDKVVRSRFDVPYNDSAALDLADILNLPAATPGESYVLLSSRGVAGGVAGLGSDGKVPANQLPAASGGTIYWDDVEDKPTAFPAEPVSYEDLEDVPDLFPPVAHDHPMSQVTGLVNALEDKADLVGGVIPTAQIPVIAIVDFLGSVSTQGAMLALVGQKGDWCIRTDLGKTYVVTGSNPTQLSSWTPMPLPAVPVQSVNGQIGDVVLGKTEVGLPNVDNTSDAAKPVSTAQQNALNLKAPLASPTFTGTVSGVTAAMVGLGNVTNTSDAAKPVSTAQQAALDLKAPLASPTFTGTVSGVTKTHVGLGNVDNTSDVAKPVSTAQQTALDLKSDLTDGRFFGAGILASQQAGGTDLLKIQATVDAASTLGGWALIDGARSISGTVTVPAGSRIDMSRGSITQTSNLMPIFKLNSVSGVRFKDVNLVGKSSDYANNSGVYDACGIWLAGTSSDVVIEGGSMTGIAGLGIRINTGVTDFHIRNVKITGPGAPPVIPSTSNYGGCIGLSDGCNNWSITGCELSQHGQGIVTGEVNHFVIANNWIHDIVGQHGMYLEPGARFVISGNLVENTKLQGIKLQIPFSSSPDDDSGVIVGNTVVNCGSHPLLLATIPSTPTQRHRRITIAGNTLSSDGSSTAGDGIIASYGVGLIINSNIIHNVRNGVNFTSVSAATVSDNRIHSTQNNGILLTACADIDLLDNRVIDPAISNNAVAEFGIQVAGASSDIRIDGNKVSDSGGNMRYGLYLAATSPGQASIVVRGNDFTGATDYGARFDSAQGLKEWSNNVVSGTMGRLLNFPTVPVRGNAVINILDHGITANGIVDDITALNALFTASPANSRFVFPPGSNCKVTSPLVISKSVTIDGDGATITNAGTTESIQISAGTSGVTIRSLALVGPGSGTVQALGHAIHALGTLASPVTDVVFKDLKISGFGKSAFWLEGCNRFTIRDNTVSDIAYAGIMTLSCQWGVIAGNKIRNLVQPTGYINSYGIALSRDSSQTITLAPRTSDVLVQNNLVDGVPSWEGIDSHGGERLVIVGNRVYNCFIPIAMVSCNNESAVDSYGCRDVVVSNNVIRSGVTNGTARAGIQLIGAGSAAGSPTEYATGVISGNIIEDCGTENSSVGSGLIIRYSEGVVVTGNVLRNPSLTGILIDHTNSGFSVTGNTIIDAWTTASSFTAAILVNSTYNVGYIGANNGIRGSKSATIVNQRGVYLNSGAATGSNITLGSNDFSTFSLPLVDSGNLGQNRFDGKLLGFYGVTPVARPTSTTEIKAALASLGLLIDGGASPLDLDGGLLTAGTIKAAKRVVTTTSSTTPTPDAAVTDIYDISALAAAAAFGIPTGSPTDGQPLTIRIKDDGNARALTWNAIYRAVGTTLPTTTVAGKMLYVGCIYNTAATKWDVLAVASE